MSARFDLSYAIDQSCLTRDAEAGVLEPQFYFKDFSAQSKATRLARDADAVSYLVQVLSCSHPVHTTTREDS